MTQIYAFPNTLAPMKGLPPRPFHPLLQILLMLGLVAAGLCVGTFLGAVVSLLGFGVSAAQIPLLATNPALVPHGWYALMLMQGLQLAGAGAGAALLPRVLRQGLGRYFAPRPLGEAWWPVAAAVLAVCLLPVLSPVVAWNAGVHFPAFLQDFEHWARAEEDRLADLTKSLMQFPTAGRLAVGLLVVGVVPALAEEVVFRGVMQPNLVRWFNSRHVGVWLTAAVFSAIHVQFFGFVPRMLLGLLLGYLYEWSGNILVPMAAHFTNNAFQLVLVYLAQHGLLSATFDPDATPVLPWPTIAAAAALSAALLYLLHQRMAAAAPAETSAAIPPTSL
jgi:membrane protease YdiL (CAAX protease family)